MQPTRSTTWLLLALSATIPSPCLAEDTVGRVCNAADLNVADYKAQLVRKESDADIAERKLADKTVKPADGEMVKTITIPSNCTEINLNRDRFSDRNVAITDEVAVAIAAALQGMTAVTSISFEYNDITDVGAAALAGVLASTTALVTIDFRQNMIKSAGAVALSEACSVSTSKVTSVDMGYNEFGYDGMVALTRMLESNTGITSLEVDGNSWSDQEATNQWIAAITYLLGNTQERANAPQCSGSGVLSANENCICYGGILGYGPTCSEWTDATTCNGLGEVDADGACTCGNGMAGPTGCDCTSTHCPYTNDRTCKGHGKVQGDGSCNCDAGYGGKRCAVSKIGVVIGFVILSFLLVIYYVCVVKPALMKKESDRAIGLANPLTIRTLAGERVVLADWGAVHHLHSALFEQHPSLGAAGAYVLLATRTPPQVDSATPPPYEGNAHTPTIVVGPKYGSPERAQLLSGVLDRSQLVLTFAGRPSTTHEVPHRLPSLTNV